MDSRARSRMRDISISNAYSANSAPRRSAGANNVARYLSRSALRTKAAQYLSFSFIQRSLARGLRDGDQSRADTPVFSQKDVVGAHGRAGRARLDRQR